MSKYQVVTMIKVRTKAGTIRELSPGETVTLSEDMASPLLEAGRIKAIVPFLDLDGSLVIPFDADPRYHWWKEGGQSIKATESEVRGWKH